MKYSVTVKFIAVILCTCALVATAFSGIGIGIKKAEGWGMIMPCCCVNGSTGYFPMMDSYEEGGYEARSSRFKAGVAEHIISEGTKLLGELR